MLHSFAVATSFVLITIMNGSPAIDSLLVLNERYILPSSYLCLQYEQVVRDCGTRRERIVQTKFWMYSQGDVIENLHLFECRRDDVCGACVQFVEVDIS